MPSSAIESVPYVIEYLRAYRHDLKSILDVGIGFGKFGYLIRDYFEAKDHHRFQPKDWKVHLAGVEIFEGYLSQVQRCVYDDIYIGDVFDILPRLHTYEVALVSDVIEHFSKTEGFELLDLLFGHVRDVIVTTPNGFLPKRTQSVQINPHEAHLSGWITEDFQRYTIVKQVIVPRIRKSQEVIIVYLRR